MTKERVYITFDSKLVYLIFLNDEFDTWCGIFTHRHNFPEFSFKIDPQRMSIQNRSDMLIEVK